MSASQPAVRLSTGSGGLEWPEVLALLAREARTPMGREEALAAIPLADPDAVRRALGETTQARTALGQTGAPPWEGVVDVRPMLEAARVPGSVAEAADLAAPIPLLEAAGRLRAYGHAIAPVAPDLAAALAGFSPQRDLADLLARSIDADGQLRDDASPALRRVRGRIRDLRREIVKRLEAYSGAPGAEVTFQERYVTVRHGRYVLPIRAEAKSRLRGIVHDRSQSGATLFVEPEGMVEANNDLVQAAREEETEILRILAALTDAVREALPDLDALVAGIGGLALIFARGALPPRREGLEPARAGARLPVFSQVFAIVGDDQSVAENLSTFSAFVKQLRDVLERVDGRSLVLLDELGAGTDPDDGAALAQAVLEALAERGAVVAASTHLEPLKGFASTHPRARNASVEFDPERLAPTFRLVYDRPGQSDALSIGPRLRLPPALIERAHPHRSTQHRQLLELLARLADRDRRDAHLYPGR